MIRLFGARRDFEMRQMLRTLDVVGEDKEL